MGGELEVDVQDIPYSGEEGFVPKRHCFGQRVQKGGGAFFFNQQSVQMSTSVSKSPIDKAATLAFLTSCPGRIQALSTRPLALAQGCIEARIPIPGCHAQEGRPATPAPVGRYDKADADADASAAEARGRDGTGQCPLLADREPVQQEGMELTTGLSYRYSNIHTYLFTKEGKANHGLDTVPSSRITDEAGEPPYTLRRPSQGDGRGAKERLVGADNEQVEGILAVLVKWVKGAGKKERKKSHAYASILYTYITVRAFRRSGKGALITEAKNDIAVVVLDVYI
jgi:hypothetical protein